VLPVDPGPAASPRAGLRNAPQGGVLFGVSLALSFAIHDPPAYAIAQATGIFVVAVVPSLVLALGPSDEALDTRLDQIVTYLPEAEAAWREHKSQLAAERVRRE
jgi:hypothetical protein